MQKKNQSSFRSSVKGSEVFPETSSVDWGLFYECQQGISSMDLFLEIYLKLLQKFFSDPFWNSSKAPALQNFVRGYARNL